MTVMDQKLIAKRMQGFQSTAAVPEKFVGVKSKHCVIVIYDD
jgi:hypothetical protein